jgi:hypothetical protein
MTASGVSDEWGWLSGGEQLRCAASVLDDTMGCG